MLGSRAKFSEFAKEQAAGYRSASQVGPVAKPSQRNRYSKGGRAHHAVISNGRPAGFRYRRSSETARSMSQTTPHPDHPWPQSQLSAPNRRLQRYPHHQQRPIKGNRESHFSTRTIADAAAATSALFHDLIASLNVMQTAIGQATRDLAVAT